MCKHKYKLIAAAFKTCVYTMHKTVSANLFVVLPRYPVNSVA